jgi:hypothetical protein
MSHEFRPIRALDHPFTIRGRRSPCARYPLSEISSKIKTLKVEARSMRKTMLFASGVLAFMIVSIAAGQQGKRVDDAALAECRKEW